MSGPYDAHAEALRRLERAEEEYLFAAGWKVRAGLWYRGADGPSHIARVAAYKQRQEDTRAANDRAKVAP